MNVTPDGVRYLALAQGQRVARPFHFRWLIPKVCGMRETFWRAVSGAALVGMLPAAWLYGGAGWRGLFVSTMCVGLAGVWKFNREHPVLVDAPAMCYSLWAAVCAMRGLWWLAVPLALLAGATKETSPVFAALWAWSPVLLIGLVAPALRLLWRAGDDVLDAENKWILDHPIKASRKYHKGMPFAVWVLPWGVCLVGLSVMSWQLAAVLLVAYAQCAIATDTTRLYQWAWPTLALAASTAVPLEWLLPLAVLHLANPFAGNGG